MDINDIPVIQDVKNFLTPPDGTEECNHCNGYGSSLKDPEGVNTCTKCKGSGLMPKEKNNA